MEQSVEEFMFRTLMELSDLLDMTEGEEKEQVAKAKSAVATAIEIHERKVA